MKREIEAALGVLVGQPVSDIGRAVDMLTVGFGPLVETTNRRGERHLISDHYLHIQETWRITRADAVVVGYADWHYPPAGSDVGYDAFDEASSYRTRQTDLVEAWREHDGADHVVAAVAGSEAGDLRISFADGCLLETFVNQASIGEADELWRLLPPRSTARGGPHFVVSVGGIWSN